MKMLCLFAAFFSINIAALSQTFTVDYNVGGPPQAYAADLLKKALTEKGDTIQPLGTAYRIQLKVGGDVAEAEAFSIVPAGKNIRIAGGDNRGLIYGCSSLAEGIWNGKPLGAASQHC